MYEKNTLTRALDQARGFTLLEIMLTIGAIAVVSAGGMAAYNSVSERSKSAEAVQDVRTVSTLLMQTWGQSGSFQELTSQSLVDGKAVPDGIAIKGGKMANPWGGPIDLAPTPDNTAFILTMQAVPSGSCTSMTSTLAKNFGAVGVNGTQVLGEGQTLDFGTVSKLCAATDKNAVAFTSRPVVQPDMGEVPLPPDHGAIIPPPVPAPPTKGAMNVAPVGAINAPAPVTLKLPTTLQTPTVTTVGATPVAVGNPTTAPSTPTTGMPPKVATPPPTCFPSTVSTPVVSTIYNNQTQSCQSGYVGQINQQQSAQQTVTTTTVTFCATAWSTPSVSTTSKTDVGTWSAWQTVGNTCAAMCSTRLASYAVQYNYNWVTVNDGCPSGYNGQKTHQVLQVQTNTPYCANGSAAADPVWTGWSGWSNTANTQNYVDTCTPAVQVPPTPSIAFAMWGGMIDVSPSPTATSYQIGISCQPLDSSPVPSSIQTVPNSGLTTSNGAGDSFSPALRIGAGSGGQSQVVAMTAALPATSCTLGIGFWNTSAWVRACNSAGCSSWNSLVQFCSWSRC